MVQHLHVISDYRDHDWRDQKAIATAVEGLTTAGVSVNLVRAVPETHSNLSVVELTGDTQVAAVDVPLRMRVAVKNFGSQVASDVRLSIFDNNDKLPASVVFEKIDPQSEVAHEFEIRLSTPAVHKIRVSLDADCLPEDNIRSLAIDVSRSVPVLVIDGDPTGEDGSYIADAIAAPILVGAVVTDPSDPTHILNLGIVWQPRTATSPGGPTTYYSKQHPVPFGEWIPMRGLLSKLITRFDRVPRDFGAGTSTGVLDVGPARLGDLICFEVAYNDLSRNAVLGIGVVGPLAGQGARILAVQTNNATYGYTGQPEQQLAMSRLRAVEHGRAVLVAATSGISAVLSPDGTVSQSLPEFTPGYLVEKVPLRDSITVSDRLGAWPELLMVLGALAMLMLVAFRRRTSGTVGSDPSPSMEESLP